MPKEKIVDLLYELMKNSKRSDRELAKVVDVSQPTITRLRKGLEQLNLIREYTVMPALDKLGFEVLAFNYGKQEQCNMKVRKRLFLGLRKTRKYFSPAQVKA